MALMFLTRKRNRRSNINLSHVSPTSLAPGNLIPISWARIFAGDNLRFSPSAFVQAFPMKAPLVNGFKVCLEYFFIPDRLYNFDLLADNSGVTDQPETVKFPCISSPAFSQTSGMTKFGINFAHYSENWTTPGDCPIVGPGSLADYMNFPVGLFPTFGSSGNRNKFNARLVVGYLDIICKYYANQQYTNIPSALWTPNSSEELGSTNLVYNLNTLQDAVNQIKRSTDPDAAIANVVDGLVSQYGRYTPFTWDWLCSRASIFQRCLPPYYLESWLATSGYEDAEIKVDLESDGNSISFRNISTVSHIQRWMDLALAGGSCLSDFESAQFDVSRIKHTSSPVFLGSDRQYLGSNVIYQTTGFDTKDSPLGAFAGQMSGGEKFRKRSFRFGECGYFVVIASLVPDVVYLRGIDPLLREKTLADRYAPALDNIAMRPLMVEELNAVPPILSVVKETSSDGLYTFTADGDPDRQNKAVGFIPAWSEIMQVVSRAHGRLATELKYFLLTREYGDQFTTQVANIRATMEEALQNGSITYTDAEALNAFLSASVSSYTETFSPYVRSNAYNAVFSDTSDDAQNFVLTFSASMSVNREKAKVNIPNTI